MKALTTTVARVLFAIPFGVFGLMHFMNAGALAGYVPAFIPGGIFWVYLVGVGLLAACISIITGKQGRLACLLLAAMLGIFILTIHLPGAMSSDPQMMQMSMSNMLKDLGLAAGALTYAGIFAGQEQKVSEKVSA